MCIRSDDLLLFKVEMIFVFYLDVGKKTYLKRLSSVENLLFPASFTTREKEKKIKLIDC